MWMVGYNEGGEFNMVDPSFNGRKLLRPLMPRPMTSPNNTSTPTTTPCLNHNIHGKNLFSQFHHLDHSKREELNNVPAVVVSSRWNPTPEQLRALEELYRRGTRTPSAEQIQHITAQLRRFGKIEGKNVFYWFQNHKARERQKRRRQMESASADHLAGDHHHHHHRDFDSPKKKESDASRTVFEVEETRNWAPSTLAEESVSIQRAAAKADIAVCNKTHGWLQFDEGELQHRRNIMERNATWHLMQFSCPPPPAPASTYLINTPPPNAYSAPCSMATPTTTVTTRTILDQKLIKTHDLSFFISPQREKGNSHEDDNCVESNQTLQLFPLRGGDGGSSDKETEISASAMNANLTPSQFFEFLPLKN